MRKSGNEKLVGTLLMLSSVVLTLIYIFLLFIVTDTNIQLLTIRITILLAIIGISGIMGWIGYTLITTPPPKEIEEIEKEIEEEIKRLEKELEGEERKQ